MNKVRKAKGVVKPMWQAKQIAWRESLSIVPPSFKERYAEKAEGRRKPKVLARSCGDWLAETLANLTLDEEGHLDVPALEAVLDANGVPHAHIGRTSPGWQGRLRMSGRVMLAARVLRSRELVLPDGGRIAAPRRWLRERRLATRP